MRLASFTDYSLRVLIYLALKDEELSTVAEIADKYQISKNHLVKVVHNLSMLGLVSSFKGKGGGIRLNIPPEKVNIGQLIRDLEQDSLLVECFAETSNCSIHSSCKLKGALKIAEKNFYKTLEQYSLAEIVSNRSSLKKDLTY